jgi:hypothetical protein
MSKVDELARLHDLFVRGAITSEEFAAMKAKIIAEPQASGVNDKIENTQHATASMTGKYIAFIIGAICIGWIVTGLVEAVIGLRQYELEKSRALAVGLIAAYVLPTGLVAGFLIRRKRNVIGISVIVGDAILLSAAALLFHFSD